MRTLVVFPAFVLAVLLGFYPMTANTQVSKESPINEKDVAYIKEFLTQELRRATLLSKVTAEHADGAARCIVHLGMIHPSDDAEKGMDKNMQEMRDEIKKLRAKAKVKTDKETEAALKLAEAVMKFMELTRKRLGERRESARKDCIAILGRLHDNHEVREVFCEGVTAHSEALLQKQVDGFMYALDARTKIAALFKKEKQSPDQEKELATLKKFVTAWEEYWKTQSQHNKDVIAFYAPMTLNRKIRLRAAESRELNDRIFKLTEKERKDPKIEKKVIFEDREDFAVLQMMTKTKQRIVPILFGAAHDFSDNVAAFNKTSPRKVSHSRVLPFATLFPF